MTQKVPFIVQFLRKYFNLIGRIIPSNSSKLLQKLFSTPRTRVLKPFELEILNKAKKSFLEVENNQIKVYQWGDGDKLAMLFHGWETNAGSLGAFVEPLIKEGYKVIAFDSPAHGGSSGKRANLLYFKSTAKAIIKVKGIPEVAIGHSLGADSIIMTAYEENIVFSKTILIAPLNRLMSVFEQLKEMLTISDSLFDLFVEDFSKISGYPFKDFYFHNYGNKTQLKNVLLFHDKNDRITNFSHAKDFKENWAEINLIPIEKSGHYKILWDKQVLKQSMRYINN